MVAAVALFVVPFVVILQRRARGSCPAEGRHSRTRTLALIGFIGGASPSPWTWSVVLAAFAYGAEGLGPALVCSYAIGLGSTLGLGYLACSWCGRRLNWSIGG